MFNGFITVPWEAARNVMHDSYTHPPLTIVGMGTLPTFTMARYPRQATLDSAFNEYVGRGVRDGALEGTGGSRPVITLAYMENGKPP